MDQVRLIVVATLVSNACPVERRTAGERGCAVEAEDAIESLWGYADVAVKTSISLR